MSDPLKSTDIEDVLSSIRRLVSEDARSKSVAPPAPEADKLVLTPALRVPDAENDPDRSGEAVEPDNDADHDARAAENDAGEAADWQDESADADHPQDDAEDGAAQADHGTNDSVSEAHGQDDTSQDQPVAQDGSDLSAEPATDSADGADALGEIDPDAAQLVQEAQDAIDRDVIDTFVAGPVHRVEDRSLDAAQGPDAPADHEDQSPETGQADDARDMAVEWEDHSPEAARTDNASHGAVPSSEGDRSQGATDWSGTLYAAAGMTSVSDDQGAQDQAAPETPAKDREGEQFDFLAGDDAVIDEEALRELVADIVRQELQGALGERITRNVRKLVRREIHRALSAQEFD